MQETDDATALTLADKSDASPQKSSVRVNLPTASGMDRAMHCAGSMALPQVYSAPGKAAVRGSVLHKFIETARTRGRQEALAEIADDDLRNQAATIDLESLPVGAESEVALAYNPSTGHARRLTLPEQRGYPNEDGVLYGTADLVGVGSDFVFIADFKTGQPAVSARESWQLRFLATAAAVLAEKRTAKVAMLYLSDSGTWRQDPAEFSTADLGSFASEMREMMRRGEAAAEDVANGNTPPLSTGGWCRWCKSMSVCPAQAGLVRALVPTLADVNDKLVSMTPAERGQAYLKFKQAEDLVKTIKAAFDNLVEAEPIPLPGGMVLKKTFSSRSVAHRDAAKYLLSRLGPETLAACADIDIKSLSPQIKAELESANLIETKRFPVMRQVKSR